MDEAKHGEPSATKEDKNPRGGLSAKGRKKFGVKKGVTGYSSSGDEGKRRWVRWALRFTKTPQPLKKPDGSPTRYALMFRAWGEPVPTTAAAVRAVHAKALARRKQLKMGQDAAAETEWIDCSDCEQTFLTENALWTHVQKHLDSPDMKESAMHACTDPNCERSFLDAAALDEHASAVHTFEDTRQLVSEALREKYGVGINGASKVPYEQRTYVYVRDIAEDWVVFDEESGGMSRSVMKKVGYALDDKGQVAFVGEPVEVVRKTVYEAKTPVGA